MERWVGFLDEQLDAATCLCSSAGLLCAALDFWICSLDRFYTAQRLEATEGTSLQDDHPQRPSWSPRSIEASRCNDRGTATTNRYSAQRQDLSASMLASGSLPPQFPGPRSTDALLGRRHCRQYAAGRRQDAFSGRRDVYRLLVVMNFYPFHGNEPGNLLAVAPHSRTELRQSPAAGPRFGGAINKLGRLSRNCTLLVQHRTAAAGAQGMRRRSAGARSPRLRSTCRRKEHPDRMTRMDCATFQRRQSSTGARPGVPIAELSRFGKNRLLQASTGPHPHLRSPTCPSKSPAPSTPTCSAPPPATACGWPIPISSSRSRRISPFTARK